MEFRILGPLDVVGEGGRFRGADAAAARARAR
jgi:hypothetical protein